MKNIVKMLSATVAIFSFILIGNVNSGIISKTKGGYQKAKKASVSAYGKIKATSSSILSVSKLTVGKFMDDMFKKYKLSDEEKNFINKMQSVLIDLKNKRNNVKIDSSIIEQAKNLVLIPDGKAKNTALDIFNYALSPLSNYVLTDEDIEVMFEGVLAAMFRQKMPINIKIIGRAIKTAFILGKKIKVYKKLGNLSSKNLLASNKNGGSSSSVVDFISKVLETLTFGMI